MNQGENEVQPVEEGEANNVPEEEEAQLLADDSQDALAQGKAFHLFSTFILNQALVEIDVDAVGTVLHLLTRNIEGLFKVAVLDQLPESW